MKVGCAKHAATLIKFSTLSVRIDGSTPAMYSNMSKICSLPDTIAQNNELPANGFRNDMVLTKESDNFDDTTILKCTFQCKPHIWKHNYLISDYYCNEVKTS